MAGTRLAPGAGILSRLFPGVARMSSFGTFLIGFLLIVAGLAFGAYLLNVPATWIAVGVIVAIGLGIVSATTRTRPRDRV